MAPRVGNAVDLHADTGGCSSGKGALLWRDWAARLGVGVAAPLCAPFRLDHVGQVKSALEGAGVGLGQHGPSAGRFYDLPRPPMPPTASNTPRQLSPQDAILQLNHRRPIPTTTRPRVSDHSNPSPGAANTEQQALSSPGTPGVLLCHGIRKDRGQIPLKITPTGYQKS